MTNNLLQRAEALKLHGLISHWNEIEHENWVEKFISWEEVERAKRSLERRMSKAHLGRFKPLCQFDWDWPSKCDRNAIEEWMGLEFIEQATNLILCGPNGVGKSTIARNIAYQAVLKGYTALFTTAGEMLNNLSAQDGDNALLRRIKQYVQPTVLTIDLC